MRTSIKAVWNGMIPVRNVFVDEAIKRKEDLEVEVDGKVLVIPFDKLTHPRISKPVKDYYSKKMQKLLYYGIDYGYKVVPEKEVSKQEKLFQ